MSRCKQDMIDDGEVMVPRTCPVHGLRRCRDVPPMQPAPAIRKLYLAARFADQAMMRVVGDYLTGLDFVITARWVYGGEAGLSRAGCALMDIEDVDAADTVVSFTQPERSYNIGGGRHTELGYALAKGKRLVVIGPREQIFHYHPAVEVHATLTAWLGSLENKR